MVCEGRRKEAFVACADRRKAASVTRDGHHTEVSEFYHCGCEKGVDKGGHPCSGWGFLIHELSYESQSAEFDFGPKMAVLRQWDQLQVV